MLSKKYLVKWLLKFVKIFITNSISNLLTISFFFNFLGTHWFAFCFYVFNHWTHLNWFDPRNSKLYCVLLRFQFVIQDWIWVAQNFPLLFHHKPIHMEWRPIYFLQDKHLLKHHPNLQKQKQKIFYFKISIKNFI